LVEVEFFAFFEEFEDEVLVRSADKEVSGVDHFELCLVPPKVVNPINVFVRIFRSRRVISFVQIFQRKDIQWSLHVQLCWDEPIAFGQDVHMHFWELGQFGFGQVEVLEVAEPFWRSFVAVLDFSDHCFDVLGELAAELLGSGWRTYLALDAAGEVGIPVEPGYRRSEIAVQQSLAQHFVEIVEIFVLGL
jgi:hypothetical protein